MAMHHDKLTSATPYPATMAVPEWQLKIPCAAPSLRRNFKALAVFAAQQRVGFVVADKTFHFRVEFQ